MTLEELLNILLERGWKPRNREKTLHICCYDKCKWMDYQWVHLDGWFMNEDSKKFRELVSKESGLWQYVCENGMVNTNDTPEENAINCWIHNKKDLTEWWYMRNYQYRLIESALKDESELESFILDNIKIWND